MKLNFNCPLLDTDNEKSLLNPDGSEILLNRLLSNNLVQAAGKEDILKIFEWGLTLRKTGILDLDTSDQKLLRKLIENSDTMPIITKGRLLQIFELREKELKETQEPKEDLKAV